MENTAKHITRKDVERVYFTNKESQDITRPSLTYWQDVRRRFMKNKLAILGSVIIVLMVLFAVFGYALTTQNYYSQDLTMTNIPPRLEAYRMDEDTLLYVNSEYSLYTLDGSGKLKERVEAEDENKMMREKVYDVGGKKVVLNYSGAAKAAKARKDGDMKLANSVENFTLKIDGKTPEMEKVWNKTYRLGTDYLGRDMLARLVYGARISLLVALIATFAQFCIGVLYGGIAGYLGGRVDNIMMRIVDIVSTVPLTLYVVLLMVVMGPGIKTIIIALGSVYWVDMARQVRGQVLNIKQQEFVLAARTIGASGKRIMLKHLIPNAMSTIIVTLTMNIPSAIFTESFLSFIGLGISAPAASWGTLASDALGGLRSYPYQLLLPSLCICLTVLGFNFLGDGLRDALDPKLRK
ncbi:ABC transporter permease [Clostridium sp. AF19-22AC]|uniref:Oligopeptide transport system permease protein n=1 Tax=Faecalicatena orotica TaxID=1544 RepID=A0A2Y9BMK0_9FIRM|nr:MULTISPECIES: ABC transporter permease [Clostridia]PWJ17071.1 oligopeptide transport system permease protein [Faecalicatena orotica]RHR20658.1 ABC transporter permease [Clostridium sp. AF19-22AC]SSA58828.1 oligopeptide transport system permease protein [Faecalicatena orotica]